MYLQIIFIAIVAILSGGYIYFCYRRFKQQKIIEGGIPNVKLRIFWICICVIVGAVLGGIVYGISGILTSSETNVIITSQSTTGTNIQNTGNNGTLFFGSGAVFSGGTEDTGGIVSWKSLREKLQHVPVTEKRGSSAQ